MSNVATEIHDATPTDYLLRFRIRHALKTGLVLITCVGLSNWLDPNSPYVFISAFMAFLWMTLYHQQLIRRSLERMIAILLTMALTVVIVFCFGNAHWLYMIFLASGILLLLYGFGIGWLPFACLFSAIYSALILGTSLSTPLNAPSTAYALSKQLILSSAAVIVVETLWPTYAINAFQAAIARCLLQCARVFNTSSETAARTLDTALSPAMITQIEQLIQHVQHYSRAQRALASTLILRLKMLSYRLRDLTDTIDNLHHTPLFPACEAALAPFLTACEHDFATTSDNIQRNQSTHTLATKTALLTLFDTLQSLHQHNPLLQSSEHTRRMLLLFVVCRNIKKEIERIWHYGKRLQTVRHLNPETLAIIPPLYFKWTYNEQALRTAVKGVIGIFITLFVYGIFGWPLQLHAIIMTVTLIAQANLGQSFLKSTGQFVGTILGACMGLLCVMLALHISHWWFIYFAVFFSSVIFSLISSGPEKYATLGAQMGATTPIILLNVLVPNGDPAHAAVLRVCATLEGVLVAFLISYCMWSIHPRAQLKQLLVDMTQGLALFFTLFSKNTLTQRYHNAKSQRRTARQIDTLLKKGATTFNDLQYLTEIGTTPLFSRELLTRTQQLYLELLQADRAFLKIQDVRLESEFQAYLLPAIQTLSGLFSSIIQAIQTNCLSPLLYQQLQEIYEILNIQTQQSTLCPPFEKKEAFLIFFERQLLRITQWLQAILQTLPIAQIPHTS